MFWTRPHSHVIQFIHLFRSGSSYGKPIGYSVDFRIHLGIRVLNDTSPGTTLNGPSSDAHGLPATWGFHLRFNARTGSTYDKCMDELTRFVHEQALPWFSRFSSDESLLESPDSPLTERSRERLRLAIAGLQDEQAVGASRQMLGINKRQKGS